MGIRSIVIAFVATCLAVTMGWAQDNSALPNAVITKREISHWIWTRAAS